jgi:hypothetical protein
MLSPDGLFVMWRVVKTLSKGIGIFRYFHDFLIFLDNNGTKHGAMIPLGVVFDGELISGVGWGF